MTNATKIVIGIQARTTSTRLFAKVFKPVGGQSMLDAVIAQCKGAALYLNRHSERKGRDVQVVLCVPFNDPIKAAYGDRIPIVEGPEHDVLARYVNLASATDPDYVVRITADCPLIPEFVISKHITIAMMNGYDYLSNVDERWRTAADGWDCEVISQRLLAYANESAKEAADREHVTTYLRKNPPRWGRYGTTINHLDQSQLKYSVDTEEDLRRVNAEQEGLYKKRALAEAAYGKKCVHSI